MLNDSLPPASGRADERAAPAQVVAEACCELEAIVHDLQSFMQGFGQRMRDWLVAEEQELALSTPSTDDMEEREQWELRRLIAEQKLRQQAQMLSAAWLQLETEQRSLLQTKQGLALEMSSRLPDGGALANDSLLPRLPGNGTPSAEADCAVYSEFEQLRREVQASRAQHYWPQQHAQ